MTHTALLVVDVQNAMFTTPGFTLHDADNTVAAIRQLIVRARETGIEIIYVQHTSDAQDHPLRREAEGWPIHASVAPLATDIVVEKTTPDAFRNTTLLHTCQTLQISHLVIAGMQTEFCIDTTVRRACSLGFQVTLAVDAHTTFDTDVLPAKDIRAHHNRTLSSFGTVVPTEKITFRPAAA